MFKGTSCCKNYIIKYLFCIKKKPDEYIENKDIPQQSFLDVGNVLLEKGGIDLLEKSGQDITPEIIENVDIPDQSFLDLGKTLLEIADFHCVSLE
jgi:hypothetical protein